MAYFIFDGMEVKMKTKEMWTILWSLLHDIERCVGDPHYLSHPDSFELNMKGTISLAQDFARALGRSELFEASLKEFKDWRDKLPSKS